uniref:Uncharacterized protein n=1 Tax=Acrobeloides nanus TaxID=290746 RepID=A0A914BZL5_9BILA
MKLRKSGNTNGSFKKGFQYFDAMQFLIPYLTIAELDPSAHVKKEVEVNEEKFNAPETSSSPLKDSNRLNISTSEAVESSNNTDLAPENVITEMEVGSFEAIKIKESEEKKDPVMDHIETPTLEHIDEFTLQDSSTFMRTPTMSTIKRAFDSAFNQPMVFDEEVTSAANFFGARLRIIKLHSELAYVECSKEISDIIYKYEIKRFRRDSFKK